MLDHTRPAVLVKGDITLGYLPASPTTLPADCADMYQLIHDYLRAGTAEAFLDWVRANDYHFHDSLAPTATLETWVTTP